MSFWDWKAYFYDRSRSLFPLNWILKNEVKNIVSCWPDTDANGKTVLDVGTGTGTILKLFDHFDKIFAVDCSFKMIQQARKVHVANFVMADTLHLPFKPHAFHLITAIGLSEYVPSRGPFLHELNRVLQPEGHIILTYSQKSILNWLRNFLGHRLYLFSAEEFARVLTENRLFIRKTNKTLLQRQLLIAKEKDHAE